MNEIPARRGRRPAPEAVAEGTPTLALRDEDREAVGDVIAELLVQSLQQAEAHGHANAGR